MTLAHVTGISKSFGGVSALIDVDLEIASGEVHALCGENGAGKSTLIKILSGAYAPDRGTVSIGGEPLPHSVHAASALGVGVIHQESVACLDLDAVDNVFVGREMHTLGGLMLDRAAMARRTRELLAQLGEEINVNRPIGDLPLAQRQMISMARALAQECRLLIMDEPTASLSAREAETLFVVVRRLRAQGVSILYVSHRMEEIFDLADRVTVLRDGRCVTTAAIADLSPQKLVELMVGRTIEPMPQETPFSPRADRPPLLDVRRLSRAGEFSDISFHVCAGEVVGLAGLVGAGRSEVASALFGVTDYDQGSVVVDGKPLPRRSIGAAIQRGLGFVPEDRQRLGLVLPMTVAQNLSLALLRSLATWGLVRTQAERQLTSRLAEELQVRAARLSMPAEALSGGNQQKLVLGKWLATKPRVLLLDEPTRGVDVAAKQEIHRRIRRLASEGTATLVISSELPEILRLSDRILVMREGVLAGQLERGEATEKKILELALPRGAAENRHELRRSENVDGPSRSRIREWLGRRETWLFALLAATICCVGALKPSFLAPSNLRDVAAEAAPIAIVACAATLVIVTGEIDISIGSIAGFTAALLGICCYGPNPSMSVPLGVACALTAALGLGMINGVLVTLGRVPSIIATLGMLTVLRGITKLIMKGASIEGRPDSLRDLATGKFAGMPVSIWLAAIVVVTFAAAIRRTASGRRIYAVGSNAKAAPLWGVSVPWTKFFVFSLMGLMTGLATVVLAPKNSIIQPNLGEGLELLVVTCVVVGGASISGGRGTIAGTLLAVVLLSLVPTALTYIGAPPEWRLAIQGAFILTAVLADHWTERRRTRGAAP